jgi:murein DD-endopeptidase MepM/ murein hydrolase activator NlpD
MPTSSPQPAAIITPAPTTPIFQTSPPSTLAPTGTDGTAGFSLCSPLDIHPLSELPEIVTDPYNPPPPGKDDRHQGVDFSYYRRGDRLTIQGVGVQSVLAGEVAAAITDKFPYGNMVIVETAGIRLPVDLSERLGIAETESLYVLYAHMEAAPLVELGQPVSACQALGTVGMSGNAVNAHLHLETRIGPPGTRFASMMFYSTQATPEEMANYVLWRTSGVFRHFDPMRLLTVESTP